MAHSRRDRPGARAHPGALFDRELLLERARHLAVRRLSADGLWRDRVERRILRVFDLHRDHVLPALAAVSAAIHPAMDPDRNIAADRRRVGGDHRSNLHRGEFYRIPQHGRLGHRAGHRGNYFRPDLDRLHPALAPCGEYVRQVARVDDAQSKNASSYKVLLDYCCTAATRASAAFALVALQRIQCIFLNKRSETGRPQGIAASLRPPGEIFVSGLAGQPCHRKHLRKIEDWMKIRPPLFVALALTSLIFPRAGCAAPQAAPTAGQTSAPPEVAVVTLQAKPRAYIRELPGRIAPTRIAEVRARIPGIVLERAFNQGVDVEAGATLYRLDPTPFQVEVDAATAALDKAQAALVLAQQQASRAEQLVKERAMAVAQYE